MVKTKINNKYVISCVIAAALAAVLLLPLYPVLCYASAYTAYAAQQPDAKVFDSAYDTKDGFAFGSGGGESEETAFLIATPEHLDNIRNYLGDAASEVRYYFKQVADIDLTEFLKDSQTGWLPVGTDNSIGECFYGVYDGGLFEIKGLWCSRPQDVYTGLFGYVESSNIKRIRLSLSERGITGGEVAGGIAALISETVIENCSVKGTVKAEVSISGGTEELFAGGIAGQIINNSNIECCYFSGSITDSYASSGAEDSDGISRGLGGITGYMVLSRIINCYADFSVIKGGGHDLCRASGGIAGVHGLDSVMENCLAVITSDGQVFPLTAGIIEGWLGFGAQPKLKINGSYAYYTGSAYAATDILDVPDPRGLSKDEYTRVLSAEEIGKRETYIGANGIPWDFATVWGFDRDGKLVLRVFGEAYNPPDPPVPVDLTWLWITITCIIVAAAAALLTFVIYRRKKPMIVKETETVTETIVVTETKHVYIGDEKQPLPSDLTPKEREVAALLLEWKSRKDIVEILALSANAVNFHIKNIYEKCECHSHKEFIVKFGTEKK